MKRLLTLHVWTGLLVSLPVFCWSLSGFFLALPPGSIEGEPYKVVEVERLILDSPVDVLKAAENHTGAPLEPTAITLEQRGSTITYSVFGKGGNVKVNAVTGEVTDPPPPSNIKKWTATAHFFSFAGSWRTTLLLFFSALSALSSFTGVLLLAARFRASPPSPRE